MTRGLQGLKVIFGGIGLFSLVMIMGVLSHASIARAAGLVGDSEWYGHYYYAQGGSVEFRMKLHVNAKGTVTGRSEEPATFGKGPSPKLFANIHGGNLMGSRISFTKTYDGTNEVNHSVTYFGSLGADGLSMSGEWSTAISGKFFAVKIPGAQ